MKRFIYIYKPPQLVTPIVQKISEIPHQFDLSIDTEEEQYYESVSIQGTPETIALIVNRLFPESNACIIEALN